MVVIQEGQAQKANTKEATSIAGRWSALCQVCILLTGGQIQQQKGHKPPIHHLNSHFSFSGVNEFVLWNTKDFVMKNLWILTTAHLHLQISLRFGLSF